MLAVVSEFFRFVEQELTKSFVAFKVGVEGLDQFIHSNIFVLEYALSTAAMESARFAAPVIYIPQVEYLAPPSCTDLPLSTQPLVTIEAKMTGYLVMCALCMIL